MSALDGASPAASGWRRFAGDASDLPGTRGAELMSVAVIPGPVVLEPPPDARARSDVDVDAEDHDNSEAASNSPALESRAAPPPLSLLRLSLLNSVMLASSMCWFVILIIAVPTQVASMVGDEQRGSAVGAMLGATSPISLVGAPLAGLLSDRIRSRYGRRRLMMVPGAALFALTMVLMLGAARSLSVYWALYSLLRASEQLVWSPFHGLLADVTPYKQRGVASGVLGSMQNLGNFAGAAAGMGYTAMGPFASSLLLSAVLLICTTAASFAVSEADSRDAPPQPPLRCKSLTVDMVQPLRNRDFAWVFATRLMFEMGVATITEFLEYYFEDAVDLPAGLDAETAVSVGMLCSMTSASVTAVLGGWVSDRMGGRRKVLVYAAGAAMLAASVAFAVGVRDFGLCNLVLSLFGLGYGCYLAVDFAMVLDVLPDPGDAARDMSVWSLALTLPQMVATPIAGVLLDRYQRIGRERDPGSILGFQVVFALTAVYVALSVVLVHFVRGVR